MTAMYVCCTYTPGGGECLSCCVSSILQEQDLSNAMDKERRKSNLTRKIREYTEDMQRQVKTKEGSCKIFHKTVNDLLFSKNRYR